MLSFKALSEKKTKITLNPKLKDVMEKKCDKCGEEPCKCDTKKKKKCPECDGKGCKHCGGTGYHSEGEGEMSEAKKKDDTYLETDFKKRQKNNEKARKDLMKGPQMKNPHFESTEDAYVSQEEVSEESTEEVAETETFLTFGQFIAEMPYQVYGSPDGKKEKKIGKPVKSRKYADARAAELADTHKATGGKYRSQKEEVELEEGRAEDAKASLEKVKARQKVLDTYEKKTGKKLDITKTPEHKAHKKDFPGAKRTGKKVKGAKETPDETRNRRINKATERIVKRGYTSKEKKEVKSMAKHASRYD